MRSLSLKMRLRLQEHYDREQVFCRTGKETAELVGFELALVVVVAVVVVAGFEAARLAHGAGAVVLVVIVVVVVVVVLADVSLEQVVEVLVLVAVDFAGWFAAFVAECATVVAAAVELVGGS